MLTRRNPSFAALVMSICSLSSRYAQDSGISSTNENGETLAQVLMSHAKKSISRIASERADLKIVQAMFRMSVVQERTARPNLL